jgi:hypothetical protein
VGRQRRRPPRREAAVEGPNAQIEDRFFIHFAPLSDRVAVANDAGFTRSREFEVTSIGLSPDGSFVQSGCKSVGGSAWGKSPFYAMFNVLTFDSGVNQPRPTVSVSGRPARRIATFPQRRGRPLRGMAQPRAVPPARFAPMRKGSHRPRAPPRAS